MKAPRLQRHRLQTPCPHPAVYWLSQNQEHKAGRIGDVLYQDLSAIASNALVASIGADTMVTTQVRRCYTSTSLWIS